MTIVTFRKETDKLTSVCNKKFKTPAAAKKHIEEDAAYVLSKHPEFDLGWIKPRSLDYYCVDLKNGVKCFWQYFTM